MKYWDFEIEPKFQKKKETKKKVRDECGNNEWRQFEGDIEEWKPQDWFCLLLEKKRGTKKCLFVRWFVSLTHVGPLNDRHHRHHDHRHRHRRCGQKWSRVRLSDLNAATAVMMMENGRKIMECAFWDINPFDTVAVFFRVFIFVNIFFLKNFSILGC